MSGEEAPGTDTCVEVARSAGVLTITLANPGRKNAIPPQGWHRLLEVLRGVEPHQDRVLVLTGAGGDFCAGADLTAKQDPELRAFERMRTVGDVALTLHHLPIPTVARVEGAAVGAGMSLALCCDLVVSATTARFSQIFAKQALSPDCGSSWLLPRLIGLSRAKQLALLGDVVPAPEAAGYGLVHRLAEPEDLDEVMAELVEKLRTGPTLALGLTKGLLNDAFDTSMAQAVDAEGKAVDINVGSADAREAARAFREKRQPVFVGH